MVNIFNKFKIFYKNEYVTTYIFFGEFDYNNFKDTLCEKLGVKDGIIQLHVLRKAGIKLYNNLTLNYLIGDKSEYKSHILKYDNSYSILVSNLKGVLVVHTNGTKQWTSVLPLSDKTKKLRIPLTNNIKNMDIVVEYNGFKLDHEVSKNDIVIKNITTILNQNFDLMSDSLPKLSELTFRIDITYKKIKKLEDSSSDEVVNVIEQNIQTINSGPDLYTPSTKTKQIRQRFTKKKSDGLLKN